MCTKGKKQRNMTTTHHKTKRREKRPEKRSQKSSSVAASVVPSWLASAPYAVLAVGVALAAGIWLNLHHDDAVVRGPAAPTAPPSSLPCFAVGEDAPPRLVLPRDLTATRVPDFDGTFARLWESKRPRMKYAFDAQTATTKLVNVSSLLSSGETVTVEFAIQKVEGRKSRPIDPAAELREVVQAFAMDPKAFNFNRIGTDEVLFTLEVVGDDSDQLEMDCSAITTREWKRELAAVIVNSHPFSYGCVVIAVRTDRNLPQVLTRESVEVGLLMAAQSSAHWRIGYNSLAGGASVNHLHFQGWYFNATTNGRLPVESVAYQQLLAHDGVAISTSAGYPIRTILFSASENTSLAAFASSIFSCVDDLLQHNVPHNMIFSNGGREVYLIPRSFTAPNKWDQRAGFPEVAGQIVTVTEDAFDRLGNQEAVVELLGSLSLSEVDFQGLLSRCIAR